MNFPSLGDRSLSAFERYQQLQSYASWTAEDARRVQSVGHLVSPYFGVLVDDFYDEIRRHPEAAKVITGGEEQINRLKKSLVRWLEELLSGAYDRDYVERRWRVGYRHVEIGLNQVYTNAALSRLRRGLLTAHPPPAETTGPQSMVRSCRVQPGDRLCFSVTNRGSLIGSDPQPTRSPPC